MNATTRHLPVGLLCSFLLAASVATAQSPTPAYGVGNRTMYIAHVFDMIPGTSSANWEIDANNGEYLYLTTPGARFFGGIQVPRGARILTIELEACDFASTGVAFATLSKTGNAVVTPLVSVQSGVAVDESPGCGRFSADLATPETVETTAFRYSVSMGNTSQEGLTTLGAVRILYDLQVSPAPDEATFLDVPTSDPAFQFVEALVSSGVTAGCGNGNYCPDAPLTRRQMAVFLSKLLGLNWPEAVAP